MTAASVVDFPEPVGPVTKTNPRLISAICSKMLGMFSCCKDKMEAGIRRRAKTHAIGLIKDIDTEPSLVLERKRKVYG